MEEAIEIDVATDDSDSDVYEVEKIVKRRVTNGGAFEYFVKWVGYSSRENTWEPIKNLQNCTELVKEFEAKLAEKKSAKASSASNSNSNSIESLSGSFEVCGIRKDSLPNTQEDDNGPEITKGDEKSDEDEDSHSSSCSSSSSDDDIPTVQEKLDCQVYGPHFRRDWRKSETPLCILGSASIEGGLHHLVRLKPSSPDEIAAAEKNPFEGINDENCVVIRSGVFREEFPHLLIKYYKDNTVKVENGKTQESIDAYVASIGIFKQCREKKLKVDGTPILDYMMGDKLHKLGAYYLDRKSKHLAFGQDLEGGSALDKFELPDRYEEGASSDETDDGSGSSCEDEKYETIEVNLSKKQRKN